eukprot:jgi/Mesvir1/20982/Mv08048-RA.1
MGQLFLEVLEGCVYRCKVCGTSLAQANNLLSKSFYCKHGKAYLFSSVVNMSLGPREERMMTTGRHTVCDVQCNCCLRVVGWKYEASFETDQKYKEGHFILERSKMVGSFEKPDTRPVSSHAVTEDGLDLEDKDE